MIPKIKFNELFSIQDWAEALDKILAVARQSRDSDERLALQDLLLLYVKTSPPKVELFDTIAREVIDELALAEIDASLARIAARNADLQRATAMIGAVAIEARKDARTLQLEHAFDALAKAQSAVDTFTKLEKSLAKPNRTLLAKLKAVGEAIASANTLLTPGTPE